MLGWQKLPILVTLFFHNLLEASVNIQKTARNALNALLISIFVLFVSNAFPADKWLQPPASSGMDTWIGDTYSTSAQFDARDRIGGWGDNYYTFLRFDLSGLPLVATRAVVWRYTINEGGTTTPVEWYSIGSQWQASTLTIYNTPNLYSYLGTVPAPTVGTWEGANITTLYNQWRAGAGPQNFGVLLAPVNTWNNWSSIASSRDTLGHRPQFQITYTPQANDNVIKLKWPLATSYASRVVTQSFGVDWAGGVYCNGLIEKHNGVDYRATAGTAVYAPEDGWVKHVEPHTGWGSHIVIEHNHPVSGKFTTVLWHVTPLSGISSGVFVPKGMQIATVADLGGATHFHFGIRSGAYTETIAGTGALPQTNCNSLPAFPENFMNPSVVLFQ